LVTLKYFESSFKKQLADIVSVVKEVAILSHERANMRQNLEQKE
jgi:hypothetical protein